METVQPVERLQILEKKIALIIELLGAERAKSQKLREENDTLMAQIEAMEASLLNESKSIGELSQERALTKKMVDELIQTIEQLVESVPHQEVTQ